MPNRIKLLRIQMNLSQSELANKLNVHQTAVSQWESGRNNPDTRTVFELAEFFGVAPEYLLGRSDNKTLSSQEKTKTENHDIPERSDVFTDEENELLRIYRRLNVRRRVKLLNAAFFLEDEQNGK